jgi:RecB family exonuclease
MGRHRPRPGVGPGGARHPSPRDRDRFDPGAPVSATRLETYAKCPRRFLFGRVLGVERRVYPEELWRMEATDRGTLVHAILEDYLVERLAGADRSLARLLAIAEHGLDEAEAGGLVGKPLLWRMDRAAILRNLARFHHEEGDLVPLAAEFEFGTGDEGAAPPVTVTLGDGRTVSFKGKADRVDRTKSGQLVVSDYKTGRQGALRGLSKDPLAGGTLLQLPIYASAAKARFGNGGTVHARYWLLSDQRSAPCYHLVVTDEVEARFHALVALIAEAVDAGAFPGAPVGPSGDRQFEQCRWCDFDTVCPSTRDRQWARKKRAPEVAPAVELLSAAVPDDLAGAVVRRFVDPDEVGA